MATSTSAKPENLYKSGMVNAFLLSIFSAIDGQFAAFWMSYGNTIYNWQLATATLKSIMGREKGLRSFCHFE
jgi:hypothetical protein